MELALIIDVGTTNIKAGVVSPEGEIVAHSSQAIEPLRPEKGAVEHDPGNLFNALITLSNEVLTGYREQVSVIGLSGYQFGFLPMDERDQPLTGMITLLDTRSKSIMNQIEQELPVADIYEKTSCPPLFTYIMARLIWLQQEKPDIFDRSNWFADIKSFLLYKLCGKKVTEHSIAAVTQLLNVHNLEWDQELIKLAGITEKQLPEIVPGNEIAGHLTDEITDKLGLKSNLPVLPGVYDGGAMIIGMGGFGTELGVCNLGTTAMFRSCSEQALLDDPQKRRLQTYALLPGRYAIGGAINNAGIILRWFRDHMTSYQNYEEINAETRKIDAGADGLFCLPFLTGERDPRIGNMASGSFFGLKEYHTSGHVSRAIMEGVGYTLNLIKGALSDNGVTLEKMMIGGSGSKSDVWTQILADIFNIPVQKSLTEDSTLTGTAMLALAAVGKYKDLEEAGNNMVKLGQTFTPQEGEVKIYREGYQFFVELVEKFHDLYITHNEKFGGE